MDKKLEGLLQPGETVKWSGRPKDVKLMEPPYGTAYIIRAVCAVILVIAGICLALPIIGGGEGALTGWIVLLVCVVVALYLVLDPVYVANKLNKGTFYYITDRRVISCFGTEDKTKKMKMRTLGELDEITVDKLSNGTGLIYLGKRIKRAPRAARTQFALTDLQDKEEGMPLMFYGVPDVERALAALPSGLNR
jgi:hypothetical protein